MYLKLLLKVGLIFLESPLSTSQTMGEFLDLNRVFAWDRCPKSWIILCKASLATHPSMTN